MRQLLQPTAVKYGHHDWLQVSLVRHFSAWHVQLPLDMHAEHNDIGPINYLQQACLTFAEPPR
jgi:hypothetical protein